MTAPLSIPDLVRPAFFDGERLDADDLAAIYIYHRELRWLHNRALHSWGIAIGFGVAGRKGGREVTVAPGYALDCQGRDLVLSRPVVLPVPAVSGAPTGGPALYYLTASYLADEDLPPNESREGVCGGEGAVRRIERARLRFQNPRDVSNPDTRFRRGFDVVLAGILIEDCSLAAAPSTVERREARPPTQPFVAAGSTPAGDTAWRFFPGVGTPVGVQTVVDTSSADFQRTPAYSAHVVGTRLLAANGPIIDGTTSIEKPTPTSFVLRVTLPRNLSAGGRQLNPNAVFVAATLQKLRTPLNWSVWWMGVEGLV